MQMDGERQQEWNQESVISIHSPTGAIACYLSKPFQTRLLFARQVLRRDCFDYFAVILVIGCTNDFGPSWSQGSFSAKKGHRCWSREARLFPLLNFDPTQKYDANMRLFLVLKRGTLDPLTLDPLRPLSFLHPWPCTGYGPARHQFWLALTCLICVCWESPCLRQLS